MDGLTSLWEVPGRVVEKMEKLRVLDLRNNALRHMKSNLVLGAPNLERVYLGGEFFTYISFITTFVCFFQLQTKLTYTVGFCGPP